jgi:hypothetical protein
LELGLWAFAGVASFFPRDLDIANSCAVSRWGVTAKLVGLKLLFYSVGTISAAQSGFCFTISDDACGNSVPGKHLFRIDSDERPCTPRQNFTLGIDDLCHIDVAAAVHALLRTGDSKGLAQRHRLEIPDFHGSRKRQHVAELVYLAHCFVQDGGDNAPMRVARRPGIFARQLEVANGLAGFFVQREFQPHALGIIVAAAKAMVLARLGRALDGVSV